MKTLIDLIRKASMIDICFFERTLSEQDMERARDGLEITKPLMSDSKLTRKYYKIRDGFVVRDTYFSWKYATNSSNGSPMPEGFYPNRRVTSFYDASGKLKERYPMRLYGDYNVDEDHCFVVTFNPHGRIIGKRKRLKKK